jgi:hypothetical protein
MRRSTSAALVLAALLALFASPYLHHPAGETIAAPAIAGHAAPDAGTIRADRDHGPRPHDHDLCPICRATAQARLALRAPTRAVSLVRADATLPIHLATPVTPSPAPILSSGAPRAPPARSSAALEA